MSLSDIVQQFLTDIRFVRWQEWVSTATQIMSVYYARKNNILVYPTGIIGVILAAWVYFFIAEPPLYGDGILNLYYFAMSVYGWVNWSKTNENNTETFPVSWCNKQELLTGMLAFTLSWLAIYLLLINLTDSNTPILDSLVSSSALTAMWWMAKRKIENWLMWIFSNIVAIPLNFYKGFMLFTLMYLLFLIMAMQGYYEWRGMQEKGKKV